MKVLIGCEQSGVVRDAFLRAGHDAWSCDLLPSETPSNRHIQGDVRDVIKMDNWDFLAVMHPPCTRLCNSGVRWLHNPCGRLGDSYSQADQDAFVLLNREEKLKFLWDDLQKGAELFSDCLNADIPRIAVENPVMHKYAKERIDGYFEFSQSVQPWHFGTDEEGADNVKKRTCFWLKGLPNLTRTGTLDGKTARPDCHHASPRKDRWKLRSKFYEGIANAMVDQWGVLA